MFNWLAKWVGFQIKLQHRVGETGCIWGSGSSLSGRSRGGGSVDRRGVLKRGVPQIVLIGRDLADGLSPWAMEREHCF